MTRFWKFAPHAPIDVPRAQPWVDAARITRALADLVGTDPRKAHAAARLLGFTEAGPDASRSVRDRLGGTADQGERTRLVGLLLRLGMDDDVDQVVDDAFGTVFPRECLASHAASRLYFRERARLSDRPAVSIVPRLTRIFSRLPNGELNEHSSEFYGRGKHVLRYELADQLDQEAISAAAELLVAAWYDERQGVDAARSLARQLFDVVEERGRRVDGQRIGDADAELARHLLSQPDRAPAQLVLLAAYWLERRLPDPDARRLAERLRSEGVEGRIDGYETLRDTSAAVAHVLPVAYAVRVLAELVRSAATSAAARARATSALGTLSDEGRAALRALAAEVPLDPKDLIVAFRGASSNETWAALAPRLLADPATRALIPELYESGLLADPRFVDTGGKLLRIDETAGIALLALLRHGEAARVLDAWLAEHEVADAVVRAACDAFMVVREPRLAPLLTRWLTADVGGAAELPLLMALASACGPVALPVLRERLETSQSPGVIQNLITALEDRAGRDG